MLASLNSASHGSVIDSIKEISRDSCDRTVHVSLGGIDAIHAEINMGESHRHDPLAEHLGHAGQTELEEGELSSISAVFLGLQSRRDVMSVQRTINNLTDEPLSAIIPGAALQELWSIVGTVEKTLRSVSAFVTIAGVTLGVLFLYGLLLLAQPVISSYFGLFITRGAPSIHEIVVILIMCLAGVAIGFIPGYRIYRYSLADGMTIRV